MSDLTQFIEILKQANQNESKHPRKCLKLLERAIYFLDPTDKRYKMLKSRIDTLTHRVELLNGDLDVIKEKYSAEIEENEEKQRKIDEKVQKPRMKALQSSEIDQIWEFYFLHRYNHPTPEEFYGEEQAKQYIQQMLQQITDIYDNYPHDQIFTETLPGDSKLYYVGETDGSFADSDRLMRFFQPKIFESQATENPLRIIFLGNYLGNEAMDLHNLLYIIAFNLAYPKEVIMLRGASEDGEFAHKSIFKKDILEYFDEELLTNFLEFFAKLPIAHQVKSNYKNVLGLHGGIPFLVAELNNPLNIEDLHFNSEIITLQDSESIVKQIILNKPKDKIQNEEVFHQIKDTAGYFYGEELFNPFIKINSLDLVISSHGFIKKGFKTFWNNQLLSICSKSEENEKLGNGKIIEICFPSDPEYPEEYYEDEESVSEEEDTEEEDLEQDEENEEDFALESDEEEDTEEENVVTIQILDINNLES